MKLDFIDPVCVPDVFATELVAVEDLGGVFRFSFAVVQGCELVLATRLCLLTSAVPAGMRMTAAKMALSTDPVLKALRVHH